MRAQRLDQVGLSPTAEMGALAAQLKAQGRDIIALNVGEPDFDTPKHIKQAAIDAMAAGQTKYTNVEGLPELIEAIRGKFKRENGLDYARDQVIASTGGKQVLFNALMATLNAGDEVIIPAPYWVSYPDMVRLLSGVPIILTTSIENDFKITPEQLEAAITPRTKWLMFNSPSNPSGAAYTREEIAALSAVLLKHPNLWIMADDIYEHLTYDGFKFTTFAQVEPRLYERVLTVNGVSKAYAMTGWRIGYAGGSKSLISDMRIIQSQSTTCANSIAQIAATAALNGPQDFMADFLRDFAKRRDYVLKALSAVAGLSCPKSAGAFYLYCGIDALIGKTTPKGAVLQNDKDFCMALLQESGVSTVFGAAFGASPAFRISYAAGMEDLQKACTRIAAFCDAL